MARTVADAALLLSAIAGPDDRSPISLQEPGTHFACSLDRSFKGVRIAWAVDLNNLPFDRRVKQIVNGQRKTFEALGCLVDEAAPDLRDADEVFRVMRASSFELRLGGFERKLLKDTVLQEIEKGVRLTGPQLSRAAVQRTQLYHRVRTFMEQYEFFVLPVAQVPPFDLNQPYVTEIDGVKMDSYIDWMKSCYFISVIGNPAISVPCGFTPEGLPVGIQIVGRHRADWPVLQLAHAFEQATGFGKHRPVLSK